MKEEIERIINGVIDDDDFFMQVFELSKGLVPANVARNLILYSKTRSDYILEPETKKYLIRYAPLFSELVRSF